MSYIQNYIKPLFTVPGLISGILIYHTPLYGIIAILCLVFITCIVSIKQKKATIPALAPLIVWCCMGWTAAWYERRPFERFYPHSTQGPRTFMGTVTDYEYCSHIRYPHRITLALQEIHTDSGMQKMEGSVHLYTNHCTKTAPYPVGSILQVTLTRIKNPHDSFARYLIKEGLVGSAFVEHTTIQCVGKNSYHALQKLIQNIRSRVYTDIEKKLSPKQFALFSALFLGNKAHNKQACDKLQTQFRIWGVSHIFARSGMHISMIMGIIFFILFLIPIPYSIKIACSLLIGLLYALLSWSTISFTRALIMFLLSAYCILARRYTSTLHLLGITATLILLWHPLNLFFLDFQLSFALTGALVWICTLLSNASL